MTYTPDFTDPRVLKRTKRAYAFTLSAFSTEKPRPWAQAVLIKHFGKQSNDLTDWLRKTLLICTDHRYCKDTGKVKKYIANAEGLALIKSVLVKLNPSHAQTEKKSVIDHYQAEWIEELTTKKFNYKDKSQRLWHGLQHLRREYKVDILNNAGFVNHYDISNCAPTVIYQYAMHLGMDVIPMAIIHYLENKKEIRARLAKLVDIDPSAVKLIIHALFSGAQLNKCRFKTIFKHLKYDEARLILLKSDPFIIQLLTDINDCWRYIEPTIPGRNRIHKKTNKIYKRPPTSKEKWVVYFQLERLVLESVRDYLSDKNNDCFLEHDGWSTTDVIDIFELTEHIYRTTGYKVNIDCKMCEIIAEVKEVVVEEEKIEIPAVLNNNIQLYPSMLQVEESVTVTVTPKRNVNAERQKRYRERQKLNKLTAKGN